ncbi:hypothetical protein KUTeg_010923 [Tegillarca granosa]|uniref:Laccase n=1 Tax=Tegillarca granosa TaxID=220873 RepID=A0ABQ9F2D7_TEGGR|nr:hypothetical protein KUTeg_010923 [Tegillarca granosa]
MEKGVTDRREIRQTKLPLEVFSVRSGMSYRFRIISAATNLPFRLSFDNHNLTIISSDGYNIDPVIAESLIVQAGERYDVLVHADQPTGNYWIRARTIERGYDHKYTECVWFAELKARTNNDTAPEVRKGHFQEHFLNFGFPASSWRPATVNGKKFEFPHNTDINNMAYDCDKSNCGEEKLCVCTHTINVKYGNVVQLVFSNVGIGKGGTHPIHIHGHHFYVLKMGFGNYNQTSGHLIGQTSDIDCNSILPKTSSFCNSPKWSNASWTGGNVPGLETDRPPRKDTVFLPRGGYLVTRINANNPGIWLIHCHVSLHNLESMALLLNVSSPEIPRHFPVCGVKETKTAYTAEIPLCEEFKMGYLTFVAFAVLILKSAVAYECDSSATECITSLVIENHLTMYHPTERAVYPYKGKLYKHDVTNTSNAQTVSVDEVISVDGWEEPRMVLVANRSLPGPPIIVYKGQKVKVHVTNKLLSDTTSIHWHGLPQKNNNENDGLPHVTQCPILPGQTLTYNFVAELAGTFWYHSHSGTQRNQGLYGALIIRDRDDNSYEERILTLQEWNHDWDPGVDFLKYLNGIFINRTRMEKVYKQDDDFFGSYKFDSGLINGKGRYRSEGNKTNEAPLEVFSVRSGKSYRFRIISAATILPFHPVTAESLIVQAGERYDVLVHADQPTGNYWIRARTIERGFDHKVKAILRYDGATATDPMTSRKRCTKTDMCKIINCPFPYYSEFEYTECVWFAELKARTNNDTAPEVKKGHFQEHILNFGFPGTSWWPATVNGKKFEFPHNTDINNMAYDCDKSNCGEEKLCVCTHTINVKYGNVVQLVFSNVGIDIDCNSTLPKTSSFCNSPKWSNASWTGGNVPGLETDRPTRKDTVFLPRGGYLVTRIHANNPGIWLIHCHVSLHNLDSLAFLLNVSSPEKPRNFQCVESRQQKQPSQRKSLKSLSVQLKNPI